MRIAIIGSGISGMVAGYLLQPGNELTVFEANDYIGGHTHTVPVVLNGHTYPVDTGFIVYNERNYPNFVRLLRRLQVATQESSMSFSVKCEKTGLEYNGTSLNGLFAQRRNLFRPAFLRMLRDIARFSRDGKNFLAENDAETPLGDFLQRHAYSAGFIDNYFVPIAASIWSSDPAEVMNLPARFILGFLANHGMLELGERPTWRVVCNGSREYIAPLTAAFRERIRLKTPVRGIRRFPDRVEVRSAAGTEAFDAVVIATHSDQALGMLEDPSDDEKRILGAIPYQENDTVLHTDSRLLPRTRAAWASWNYHILRDPPTRVPITYYMNELQRLKAPVDFCVTLNRTAALDPQKVHRRLLVHHPVFTVAGARAQREKRTINGVNRTYFCGAYWGFGFHEDGVVSALDVCGHFGRELPA